jgi:hypothetical protein
MTTLRIVEILLVSSLYVGTGGAVLSERGRQHPTLVVLAAIIAITSSFYLFRDIYRDLKAIDSTIVGPSSTNRLIESRTDSNSPICRTFNDERVC